MKNVILKRVVNNTDLKYCIGHVYIDGKKFCDSLEDIVRDTNHNGKFDNGEKKVYEETAIPCGTYHVTFEKSTVGIQKYSKNNLVPLLHNVPSFSSVRIHSGNTTKHTAGCLLFGQNTVKGGITNSIKTCLEFYDLMNYEPFDITIVDNFASKK